MGARREPRVAPKMKSGVALRASGVYSIGRRKKGRACIGQVHLHVEYSRRLAKGARRDATHTRRTTPHTGAPRMKARTCTTERAATARRKQTLEAT